MSRAAVATHQAGVLLGRCRHALALLPGWVQAALVFAVGQVVSALILIEISRWQEPTVWADRHPGYWEFISFWDGEWYQRIAEGGYPLPVPVDEAGNPVQSAWAFYPAYPLLVRLLMTVTGGSSVVVGSLVSVVAATAAAVVLYRLFLLRVEHKTALAAISLVATFPTAPVFQLPYAEGLCLLLLALSLYLITVRSYVLALTPVLLLGLTRPVASPLILVVAVHLYLRWRRRAEDPFGLGERFEVLVLAATSAVPAFAFPWWVGYRTGDPEMYLKIQSSWRGGDRSLFWPNVAIAKLFGEHSGPAILMIGFAALAGLILLRWRSVLGVELTTWTLGYLGYLLVVAQLWTSTFRYLLMLFPFALIAARPIKNRSHLLTWWWAMLALQVVWVAWLWRWGPSTDYAP